MSRDAQPSGTSATGAGDQATSTERAATAPHEDHPAKPDSPSDLTKPSWKYTFMKAFREFQRDEVTDQAAGLTYWAVLAVAPAALALVSLLGVFGNGKQIVADVMAQAKEVAPGLDLEAVETIVTNLAGQQGAGLALITGLLVALWSASGYVNAFGRALNRMYEIDEGRPIWKLRPWMLLITLITLVLVAITMAAMVVSGPVAEAVGGAIGLSDQAVTIWNIAKWPVVLLLVITTVAVLYWGTPNVKMPKFRWISVGAAVAILIWVLATVGFAFYVGNFGKYDETYGALAGVIVFLLWLWITNNALLFGAELDAELERVRELQAGIEAEETLQLPPRDTKASVKKQKKHDEDIARGRRLRLSRGRTDGKNVEKSDGTAERSDDGVTRADSAQVASHDDARRS